MANPFGITQVDIPGLLGMHQEMKQQRLRDLYQAKQLERQEKQDAREDAKADREEKSRVALAKVFQPKGGDPTSGSAGEAPTLVPGQPMPPRTDGLTINHDALNELYALDPQAAAQVQKMVYDADRQHLERVTTSGEAMARAADYLRTIPAANRTAELQTITPQLIEQGVSAEAIAKADLSDAGLNRVYRLGRAMKELSAEDNADRTFQAAQAERAVDNARADRADARAAISSRQATVRFNERQLDRDAIAASGGGIRTNTDDLNY